MRRPPRTLRTLRAAPARALLGLALAALAPGAALGSTARERAVEQIPELMARILDSQEEIREQEQQLIPVVEGFTEKLTTAKQEIDTASSELAASEALVEYVEAYAARLEAQDKGLAAIESSVVRMRADARELRRAAEAAGTIAERPEERQSFYQDQFQGVAHGTRELSERLGREGDAATTGAVLQAAWASHSALDVPLARLGPEGAADFARKVEGLYARYKARSNQLRAERRAVQRLLDLLIERQLARRMDELFEGRDTLGLGNLLSIEGMSASWEDLGQVVSRTLGLPEPGEDVGVFSAPSLDRLDYFSSGDHRQ